MEKQLEKPRIPSKPSVLPKADDNRIEFWGNVPFIALHLGCLLAFWTGVSPAALTVCAAAFFVRMFGLTGGYHRYFSHRSYKTSRWFQFVLALLGAASLQKDPMWWAAHHRNHHRYTDTELDEHSPGVKGFFTAHMGWIMTKRNANLDPAPLVPDLAKYPELVYLNRNQKVPALGFLGLLAALGFAIEKLKPEWNASMAQIVVWGFFVSTIALHHVTFLVNSAAHIWGPRRFETKDTSRNNAVVAILTMGEGWHNNHHRFPSSERQGFYWWEIDMTHMILVVLSWFGLVWDLRTPPKEIYEEAERGKKKR